jgi:CubicO group peptidase (beta-lactamase class C family)
MIQQRDGGEVRLPDNSSGRRVSEYIKAFNSGDEQLMRAFISSNVSSEALKRRGVDARLDVYREMRNEMGAIKPHRLIEARADQITILFSTTNGGWFEIGFILEQEPPHYLVALRVEDRDAPQDAGAEGASEPQTPMSRQQFISTVEKQIDELSRSDEFSGVVLIAKDNKPIFQKAVGLANKTHNVANRMDTRFNLGSINKIFTRVAIAQLIEKGKLTLDDTIGKHLPDYPNRQAAEKVTIKHLLEMSSGIGDIFGDKFMATPKDRIRKLQDYFQFFAAEPLRFEPGTSRQYSNGGFIVLGAIIEKAAGQDYYHYVRENVFKPAGMSNSDWYDLDSTEPNLATGYTRRSVAGARRANIYMLPGRGSSAGGGYSTAEDLLRFAIALRENRLARADTLSKTGQRAGSAYGVAGGSPGLNAELFFGPDYTIVVLSNYDPPAAERVSRQIRGWLARVKE